MQRIYVTHVDAGDRISWLSLPPSLSSELYKEKKEKQHFKFLS